MFYGHKTIEIYDKRTTGVGGWAKMDSAPIDWQQSYEQLAAAINAAPEGIALFDAEDRYVIWNARYAEIYEEILETIAVGIRFEDVVRAALAKGLVVDAKGREEEWLAVRLAERSQTPHTFERQVPIGRWIRGDERRTADGGLISVQTDITELKQREASFRLLFESNPIPMFVCDAETLAFLAVNAAAVHHYGYVGQTFANMSVYDLRMPDDREDLRQRTQAGNIGRQNGEIRRHLKADGTPIDVAVYTVSMPYNGRPAVIVAAIDVTARKKAEAENRHQKLQLDAAVDNMTQGLVMFDADERLVLWNRRYMEIFGLSLDVVKVGCTNLELMKHREDRGVLSGDIEVLRRNLLSRLAEGKPWHRHIELPDGRITEVIHHPLVDGGWVSTHEDITERVKAERVIAEREEHLSAIMNNAADCIITITDLGIVESFNHAAELTFGYSEEEIRGQNIMILLPEPDRSQHDGYIANYLATGKGQFIDIGPRDVTALRKDGSAIPVSLAISSMEVAGETKFIGVARDITERQRSQAKLSEQRLQLDAAVKNMTQGLVMFDADGRLALWNQRYIDLYGLSPDIVKTGATDVELMTHRKEKGVFVGEPNARRQDNIARLAKGELWDSVQDLPDGRSVQVVHRPMAGGGRLSTHEDITERQKAEVKIREQKLQLDAAIDNMAQGLVMFDANERIVLCNQRYIELYGLLPDIVKMECELVELIRHRKEVGAFSGDPDTFCQSHRVRRAQGTPWSSVQELPDGRIIRTENRLFVEGGWLSTHDDITGRQHAEVKIREQKFQLDAAINNIPQGLVMFDADQRLIQWNRHYIELFGLSHDIVKAGCSLLELMKHRKERGVFDGDPEDYCQRRRVRVAKGEPWRIILELPDGRRVRGVHHPIAGGSCVSTHEEITERQESDIRTAGRSHN
jgi:PAS domain S-box-containing protein